MALSLQFGHNVLNGRALEPALAVTGVVTGAGAIEAEETSEAVEAELAAVAFEVADELVRLHCFEALASMDSGSNSTRSASGSPALGFGSGSGLPSSR